MEMTISANYFSDISEIDMREIDGGLNWWSLAGGVLTVISGTVWFCGGPGKVAAGFCIAGGICTIFGAF